MDAVIDCETTGLDPLTNRIICIGVCYQSLEFKNKKIAVVFQNFDEKKMLEEFWEFIDKTFKDLNFIFFVGFNIEFDIRFIYLRSLFYKLKIKKFLHIIDVMKVLGCGQWRAEGTLKDYADFFKIENGAPHIDGSKVPALYEEGKIDLIVEYCESDVLITSQLLDICKEGGLIF